MMRHLSNEQNNLYQQYSKLSLDIINVSKESNEESKDQIWKLISNEGIWSLPVHKQYQGHGFSWQECIIAMDGFFSKHIDVKLLSLFITQISALYVVMRYGTENIKKRYLPKLIRGEIAHLYVSQNINESLNHNLNFKKDINHDPISRSDGILIYVDKNKKNDIVFYISEKKYSTLLGSDYKSVVSIFSDKDKFIAKEIGLSALCDLINFKRILYGILSSNLIKHINTIVG